jgi:muconate cycloisomerase
MKIKQIHCFEVKVPALPEAVASKTINKPLHKLPIGAQSSWTVQFDELPKLLLQIQLSNGVTAWGECYRNHDWRMVEEISHLLLGKDLRELSLQKLPFAFCREYDGFETAIWDGFAKSHGLRLVDLLGGPVRTQIRVGAWSSHREIEEIEDLARSFAAMGYDCLKFKCDLEDDVVGWARIIKETAPEMAIILDPNERWKFPGETRKRMDGLAEVGNILCLEDPIPRWRLDEYALLRQYSSVPMVLHVSLPYILHGQRMHNAISAIQAQAVDGFNFNGGLANFQRLDHIASVAHLNCWHGSEVDLGIMEAMYLHSAAAAESCNWPSDIFGRLIREHDLLTEPLKMEPPFAELPTGPGLGVEPDMEAIKHYQTDYRRFAF